MFDIRTITIGIMCVNILLAIVMVTYWRTQKTYRGFGFWSLANSISAVGYLLLGLRDMIPGVLSILAGSTLLILALIFRMEAIRYFFGKSHWLRSSIGFLVIFIGLFLYYSEVRDSALLRNTVLTASVVFYSSICIYYLCRYPSRHQRVFAHFLSFFLFTYSVIMVIRVTAWWVNPIERNLMAQTPINTLFFFYEIVAHVGTTIVFLMLNTQQFSTDLLDSREELESLATIDALTGVRNRRMFHEMGSMSFMQARRLGHPFSLLTIDFDHFQEINNAYGRAAGDMVLREALVVIHNNVRDIDILGRTDGDEFAICIPETSLDGGVETAERIQRALKKSGFLWQGKYLYAKVSIGAATMSRRDTDFDAFLQRTSLNLLEAKRSGRNQIYSTEIA